MKIVKKIDKLIEEVKPEYEIFIHETIIAINEYVTLVAMKNFDARLESKRNKSERFEISESNREKMDKEYELCLNRLKELNRLSIEHIDEEFYSTSEPKEYIEDFFLELSKEMFDIRSL